MKRLKNLLEESTRKKNNEMTIEDLYKWAVKNKCTDYKIIIQYRDEGGEYSGWDDEMYLTIDETDKTVKL